MKQLHLIRVIGVVALATWVNSCGTDVGVIAPPPPPPPPPPSEAPGFTVTGSGPFLVSNPGSMSGAGVRAGLSAGSSGLAWVALRPGALPGFARVTLRVLRTGTISTVPLHDGGLDPVAIEAVAGDTVVLTVDRVDGPVPAALVFTVPERRPPVIIRTVPPRGTRDVALNARMQVVFSEPMHADLLTSGAVSLRGENGPIPGQLRFLNASRTIVEFQPDAELAQGAAYELRIDQGVRDVDGTAIEAPEVVAFTTAGSGDSPPPPPVEPPISVGAFAFVREGRIWVADQSAQIPISTPGAGETDRFPAWSPDGSRIAFERRVTGQSRSIFVVNADGTNLRRLSTGGWHGRPSWSRDGQWVVYNVSLTGSDGVVAVRADGSSASPSRLLDTPDGVGASAISPDGTTLAVTIWNSAGVGWWGGTIDLVLAPLPGGTRRVLLTGSTATPPIHYQAVSWSPDGVWLAFTECADEFVICSDGIGRLGVVRADGTEYRVVSGWTAGSPSWSPDGAWVAFGSAPCVGASPCVLRQQLTTGATDEVLNNASDPAWRP